MKKDEKGGINITQDKDEDVSLNINVNQSVL
jgi:hypothetical protein